MTSYHCQPPSYDSYPLNGCLKPGLTSTATMAISNGLRLLLTNPVEFRTLVNFWLWHEGKRDITAKREHPTSGWDRPSMRRCWEFLDLTSRSFAAVVKELEGDLARVVSPRICWRCWRALTGQDMPILSRIARPRHG